METINFEEHENTGGYTKEITHGDADVVVDCVGMDGKMTTVEMVETALKLQGSSKSDIEVTTQVVRKGGAVSMVGVYDAGYNMFSLGDFFSRNITLKMGQCDFKAMSLRLASKRDCESKIKEMQCKQRRICHD